MKHGRALTDEEFDAVEAVLEVDSRRHLELTMCLMTPVQAASHQRQAARPRRLGQSGAVNVRRRPVPWTSEGGDLIARRLLEMQPGMTPQQLINSSRERSVWLRDRGVDPADWSQVNQMLKASKRQHGVQTALDRARARHANGGRP